MFVPVSDPFNQFVVCHERFLSRRSLKRPARNMLGVKHTSFSVYYNGWKVWNDQKIYKPQFYETIWNMKSNTLFMTFLSVLG